MATVAQTYHAGNFVRHAAQRRRLQLAGRSQLGQIIKFQRLTLLGSGRFTLVQSGQWSEMSIFLSIP